jgi:hypothetical protein
MALRTQLLFITALLFMSVSVIACISFGNNDFDSAKEVIVMRNIGHQILLSSGDRSSRVLPVSKTNNNQYQIRFSSALEISPDSVIKIVRQAVRVNHLPPDYIVNVLECKNNDVVYGFAILKTEQTSLLPCKGRKLPKAHYAVNINFRNKRTGVLNKDYILGAGGSLAAMMLIFSVLKMKRQKNKVSISEVSITAPTTSQGMDIGRYTFFKNQQYLEYDQEQIKLSDKETKVLNILASRLNVVVERSELQRVWEDEGVIVGRSLDMLISKLRKKLEKDPTVQLVNVHGKGYKMQVA